ncbi:pectate lyase family protein [Sunxiuqinia indica]|uniref:pectate lyase family protein n=1 Tax=Sunxiuqinia indica TaxID=2692584 RepID=UPI001915914B|nr:hypothetical protein [Sunxiuqinia indica]
MIIIRNNITQLIGLISFLVLGVGSVKAQQLAFPGAEGFGKYATGGRGGEVYQVTNLNDDGPGSFRDAVSKPNRIIVFEVGGVIQLNERLTFSENLTIAGQSAPGEGITLAGNGASFTNANNLICRFIRVRSGKAAGKIDAVTIYQGHDMIFDHMSVSWGTDENFSVSSMKVVDGPVNVTVQNSIIAQGLQTHSCGGLVQSEGGVSIFGNLYIDNHTRNIKVKGRNQFVNNVVYNWGSNGYILGGGSEYHSNANVTNNYFIAGPDTKGKPFTRGNENFAIYAANNYFDNNFNGKLDGRLLSKDDYGVVTWLEEPVQGFPSINAIVAADAVERVIKSVGTYLPNRDEIDHFLIEELTSYGEKGKIIADEDELPVKLTQKEWKREPGFDSDHDGMQDDWEQQNGLDPNNSSDAALYSLDKGYTNIEVYLNELVN